MTTKKQTPKEEKFQNTDFDLFSAIDAIDKKNYDYYDNLTEEQKKGFVPFMMTHWISQVKSKADLQRYYIQSVDYHANTNLFNEYVQKHPKLQWLMLCASSPNLGKQFHQWVPHITNKVGKLKEKAKDKEIKEYFSKIYSNAPEDAISEIAKAYTELQHKKVYLANHFPNLKYEDIETLADLISDEDIAQYEKNLGNQ